jgi:DUF2075 family protein
LSDIGSKQAIRAFAKAKGAVVEEHVLSSQFRCSGSDGYLAWLDDTLSIRSTANPTLETQEYEFKVFDSPQAMHEAINEKNHGNKARVVAGYCWPWLSKKDSTAADIVIGDYKRQWNLDQDGSLWIIAENSIEQVGCIHTCQGLEVDYIGVIIGPDLIVRDGKVVTSPAERDKHDKSIRGWKKMMKEQPTLAKKETDLIIKNTYRTLMTRGMKGCYLYCTDKETAQYFESRLHYEPHISKAPLFLKGPEELSKLRSFLKKHISHGDNKEVLYELSEGKIRPSKALAEALGGLMKGKPEFVLIDDQKAIFESALAAASEASDQAPKVMIIEGGPGTGKTVLAINLLVRLTELKLMSKYVSKNAAPRKVYESKLVGTIKRSHFSNFFSGSGAFIDTEPNTFDALIVDEAHRLNEKSGLYGNLGENQIKELIDSAKCSIFFIDELNL